MSVNIWFADRTVALPSRESVDKNIRHWNNIVRWWDAYNYNIHSSIVSISLFVIDLTILLSGWRISFLSRGDPSDKSNFLRTAPSIVKLHRIYITYLSTVPIVIRGIMLLLYPLLFLPLLTMAESTQATMIQERWKPQLENWRRPADWIGDGILNVAGTVLPVTRSPFDGIRGNSSREYIKNM